MLSGIFDESVLRQKAKPELERRGRPGRHDTRAGLGKQRDVELAVRLADRGGRHQRLHLYGGAGGRHLDVYRRRVVGRKRGQVVVPPTTVSVAVPDVFIVFIAEVQPRTMCDSDVWLAGIVIT